MNSSRNFIGNFPKGFIWLPSTVVPATTFLQGILKQYFRGLYSGPGGISERTKRSLLTILRRKSWRNLGRNTLRNLEKNLFRVPGRSFRRNPLGTPKTTLGGIWVWIWRNLRRNSWNNTRKKVWRKSECFLRRNSEITRWRIAERVFFRSFSEGNP